MGSSLAFSLKEDPVRCAKVCDKSWVILTIPPLTLDYIKQIKTVKKNKSYLLVFHLVAWPIPTCKVDRMATKPS